MKRLAGRAPRLDIFSDALVVRQNDGWKITDTGRQFLINLELDAIPDSEQPSKDVSATALPSPVPKLRLVVDNTRAESNSANANKLSA